MDLNKTMESITAAATDPETLIKGAMMLADHSTESESLMADRLSTESQGNVIMTAQAATEETFNEEVDINPSDAAGTGDRSGEQRVILEKFYHLKDMIWNHSNSQWHEAKEFDFPHGLFPADLDTIYVLAQYFQFLCFYRFDVVIKITCNFSPGCSGILIVFYEPTTESDVSRRNPMAVRALPNATINAKSASEAQFTIPYNNCVRMYSDSMKPVGEVRKLDWVPLSNVAGTQSDVTLSTWFHLENVECASMSVSRQPFTTSQYADTKRSFQRALNKSMGKYGVGLEFLQDFLKQVVDTGVERKCLSALTEEVWSGVENLASVMQEKELEGEMDSEVGDGVKNFAMVTANTANCQVDNTPVHDLAFDGDVPPETNSFASHRPFSFEDYVKVPCALQVVEVNKDHNPGHLLARFPVCPDYCYSETTGSSLAMWDTTSSAVGKHFGYWRGSVKLTIEDAASRLHSFRYKVIFVPNVTTLGSDVDDYASCQTVTCDIGIQELVSMTISFQSPTDWKRMIEFHDDVADFKAKCSELKYSIGQIGIYVMNPLNSTSACSDHIHLVPSWSWNVEFAYPIWQPQHIRMENNSFDSEVGEAQGTMVGTSSQEGSGGVSFETDQPLPQSYMGNHANVNKLMTRPILLDTFTFDGSSVEQTCSLHMEGHQEHVQAMAAYYRGRPIVTVYARHSGASIKGGMMIGYVPDQFHPFGNDGNTYLESQNLLLPNGAYMMNLEQEKTAVFTIPWYHDKNFISNGDFLGVLKFFPMNANGVLDIYLSWGADYNQYFPMRTPITYDPNASSTEKNAVPPEKSKFRQLEYKHEAKQSTNWGGFREGEFKTLKRLAKFLKKVDIGDIDLSEDEDSVDGTECEWVKELSQDGDVEENPGPESWAGLLSHYIRTDIVAEFLVEDWYRENDDYQRVLVYEFLKNAGPLELMETLRVYRRECVETEDYVQPNIAAAVQLGLVCMIEAEEDQTVARNTEDFKVWCDNFPNVPLDGWISDSYIEDVARGMEPCVGCKYISRGDFFDKFGEDYCLEWLFPNPGREEEEWFQEMSAWYEGEVAFQAKLDRRHFVTLGGRDVRVHNYWDLVVLTDHQREIGFIQEPPLPSELEGQEAEEALLILQGVEIVDPNRPLWAITTENGFIGRPQCLGPMEVELFNGLVMSRNHVSEERTNLGLSSTDVEDQFVMMFECQVDAIRNKIVELYTLHEGICWMNEFRLSELNFIQMRGTPKVMAPIYTGNPHCHLLLILAGDIETNPGPDREEYKVCVAEIKEMFDKYSHKKIRVQDCPLQFLNSLKQNIAFNVLYFDEFSESQTVRVCTLKVNLDLREQADFEVTEKYEKVFSAKGPNKKYVKQSCAEQFLEDFRNFLKDEEIEVMLKRVHLEGAMASEGLLDGIVDGVCSRLTGKPPVMKMLEAVDNITRIIGKIDKYMTEGANVAVAVLAMVVKVILGIVNIYNNPSATNIGFVVAQFILDVMTSNPLSKLASGILEFLKNTVTRMFNYIAEKVCGRGGLLDDVTGCDREDGEVWVPGESRYMKGWMKPPGAKCSGRAKKEGAKYKGEWSEDPNHIHDSTCGCYIDCNHGRFEWMNPCSFCLEEDGSYMSGSMDGEGAPEMLSMFVSVFLILVTGIVGGSASLEKEGVGKTVGAVLKSMKGISNLGNGLRGMNNVLEYVSKAVHGVVNYVKGGISVDERANVYFNEHKEEIATWSVEVDQFKQEFDQAESLVDPTLRRKITDLYERGCAIHAGCLFAKDANSVFTKLTINFKDVSEWQTVAVKGGKGVDGRPEPVVVLFRGEPGQGKSLLTLRLSTHFAKFYGKTRGNGVHACNPYSEHFDNYAQQPVVVMDDLGQAAEGKDFENFCQLVSTVPFYPKMAELKQKGDQFVSPIIIATTNIDQPRPKTINVAQAVWRRFAFIVNVEAKNKKKDGTLDVDASISDGTWDDLSCISLKRYKTIDSTDGETYNLKQLTREIEEELVRRMKLFKNIEQQIPDPERTFAEMMAECRECGVHDPACYCANCEGLAGGLLSAEDFKRVADTGKRGRFITPRQTGYEGLSDSALKEAMETLDIDMMSFYGQDGCSKEYWDKIKKDGLVKEHFTMMRMIQERTRREKISKLVKAWDVYGPRITSGLKTIATCCAGLLVILTAVSAFQFITYVRASKRDQKIMTNRALTCRQIHVAAEWLASYGFPCAPKHKMAPVRETIPKYVEFDELVFDNGEKITYHDACVLVENHKCEECMVHKERTAENLAKYGDSYDFKADSEGVYNSKTTKSKTKSQFRLLKGRSFKSEGAEGINNGSQDAVAVSFARNVVSVSVLHEDATLNGHGIATFLSGTEVIMPHHLLSKRGSEDITSLKFFMGQSGTKDIEFQSERVLSFGTEEHTEDFVVYVLPMPITGVRKIPTNRFVKEDDFEAVALGGITMITKRECLPWTVSTQSSVLVKEKVYQNGQFSVTNGVGYPLSNAERGAGDSGAMIMSRHGVSRDKICGMHVAGHDRAGVAIPLTYEFIHYVRSRVSEDFKSTHIEAPIEIEGVMDSHSCPLEIEGVNEYLGEVSHHPVSIMRQTQIGKSLIHGCVEVLREPAPLSPTDGRVAEEFKTDPVNNAPKKFCNGHGHPNVSDLKEVVAHTANVVKVLINQSDQPRVLTDYEMVNGLPLGEAFQQVEMSSSPGWPYAQKRVGGKKPWFKFEGANGAGNIYSMDDELEKRVLDREILACERKRIDGSYFTTFLKDELRPIYKVKKNGARTVECGPLDHLLLSRKYFGHFLNTVTKNPIAAFGCCVGINPEVDLSYAENHLREYSDTGVAEDFTTWDGTIKPALIQAAGKVIEEYYREGLRDAVEKEPENKAKLEYEFELQQNVRDVLLDEIAFTVHVSGKELCYSPTGLPSGHFFTSILNSLIHRIFNGLAWMKGTRNEETLNSMVAFEQNVRDLHYGDDGKDAIKRGVQHLYNRLIKGELAKDLGMIYTMEDKESKMVPISKLDDCGFLKRKSVKHSAFRFLWNVPIEKRTIHSLINWVRVNGKLEDNIAEAFREAYHWGELYYDGLKAVVERALIKKNVLISIPSFLWQERAFLARMKMCVNPYMKRQVITPSQLMLGRMIVTHEEDVLSTCPLEWMCQNGSHKHFCDGCEREVFGLTTGLLGDLCIECDGGEEPEGYARSQQEKKRPSEGMILMNKYLKAETHHVVGDKWCPSFESGFCSGGPQVKHHWCRGCNRLALHLEVIDKEGHMRRTCAGCKYGIVMPKAYYHNPCEACIPHLKHPHMRGCEIVTV